MSLLQVQPTRQVRGAVAASSNDRGQGDTGPAADGSRPKAEADPADLLPRSDISPQVLSITFGPQILLCRIKWKSVICVPYPPRTATSRDTLVMLQWSQRHAPMMISSSSDWPTVRLLTQIAGG